MKETKINSEKENIAEHGQHGVFQAQISNENKRLGEPTPPDKVIACRATAQMFNGHCQITLSAVKRHFKTTKH